MSHTAASPSPPTASAAHSCNRSSGTSHSTTSADAEDYLNAPLSLTITTSNTAAASASTAATTTLPDQHDATTSSPLPDSILTKALRASIGDDDDDGVDYFGTVHAGSAAHVGSVVGVGSTALVGSRSVEEKETNAAASSSIVGGNGYNGFVTTPGYSQFFPHGAVHSYRTSSQQHAQHYGGIAPPFAVPFSTPALGFPQSAAVVGGGNGTKSEKTAAAMLPATALPAWNSFYLPAGILTPGGGAATAASTATSKTIVDGDGDAQQNSYFLERLARQQGTGAAPAAVAGDPFQPPSLSTADTLQRGSSSVVTASSSRSSYDETSGYGAVASGGPLAELASRQVEQHNTAMHALRQQKHQQQRAFHQNTYSTSAGYPLQYQEHRKSVDMSSWLPPSIPAMPMSASVSMQQHQQRFSYEIDGMVPPMPRFARDVEPVSATMPKPRFARDVEPVAVPQPMHRYARDSEPIVMQQQQRQYQRYSSQDGSAMHQMQQQPSSHQDASSTQSSRNTTTSENALALELSRLQLSAISQRLSVRQSDDAVAHGARRPTVDTSFSCAASRSSTDECSVVAGTNAAPATTTTIPIPSGLALGTGTTAQLDIRPRGSATAQNPLKEIVTDAIASQKNIYLRGLPPQMTDEALRALCEPYGVVLSTKAIVEQTPLKLASGEVGVLSGQCKGYGFAMFDTHESAMRAIYGLNKLGYRVSIAKESFSSRLKSLQDEGSANLYISNIPLDVNEPELDVLFQDLGIKVMSSRILRDAVSGVSRGVGFARLENRFCAEVAIENMNGMLLPTSLLPLQIRFADNNAQKKLKTQSRKRDIGLPLEGMVAGGMAPMQSHGHDLHSQYYGYAPLDRHQYDHEQHHPMPPYMHTPRHSQQYHLQQQQQYHHHDQYHHHHHHQQSMSMPLPQQYYG